MTLTTRLYLKLLFIFCLFAGCKKHRHYYIQGSVMEANSKDPIEGATVVLQYWNPSKPDDPYSYDTVRTDSYGDFAFYRRRKIGWQYRLTVNSRYYRDIDIVKPPYIFYLDAQATVKLRVKKLSQRPTTMAISFSAYYISLKRQTPFDTVIQRIVNVKPEKYVELNWEVNDTSVPAGPNNPVISTTTLSVKTNDTTIYQIQYD